jgi:hypothetical protein
MSAERWTDPALTRNSKPPPFRRWSVHVSTNLSAAMRGLNQRAGSPVSTRSKSGGEATWVSRSENSLSFGWKWTLRPAFDEIGVDAAEGALVSLKLEEDDPRAGARSEAGQPYHAPVVVLIDVQSWPAVAAEEGERDEAESLDVLAGEGLP